jgi:hypothetical protein
LGTEEGRAIKTEPEKHSTHVFIAISMWKFSIERNLLIKAGLEVGLFSTHEMNMNFWMLKASARHFVKEDCLFNLSAMEGI